MTQERIEEVRLRIDETDQQLLEVLNRRAAYVLEIGAFKAESGLAIYDPARERRILERIRQANPGPLSNEAVTRLFERIIDESRALERHVSEGRRPE